MDIVVMLDKEQIDNWEADDRRPEDCDMIVPWGVVTCGCVAQQPCVCEMCDGAGWYYKNPSTGVTLSPMMQDALDRHG